jgi:GR25 family glycosyltransferase involved in LPS biosynthesis
MLPEEAILADGGILRVRTMLNRTPGAIGCHFSQVSIMKEALRRGEHAFVMEDDLVFCDDFEKRMDYITEFCADYDWDVIWLGGTFHVNPPYWHKKTIGRDAEQTENARMFRTFGAFCTYAYIVNRASIGNILQLLDDIMPKSIGIDWAFIQLQPQLLTYAFVPGCIKQYDNKSDIGKGMTVFSGFAKLGPYWFQPRMENFDPTTFDWHEARTITVDAKVPHPSPINYSI